jgi:predicted transcriptional regulator
MKKQKTEQSPILVSIGDTIRKKRKELGFSQEKLGAVHI